MPDPQKAQFPRMKLYCARCDKDFGEAQKGTLGMHFICPCQQEGGAKHLARVILDDPSAKRWLRWEMNLLTFQTKYSPSIALRKLFPSMTTGGYICATTLLLLAIIFAWQFMLMLQEKWQFVLVLVVLPLVLWRFADIFLTNISITFTSRFPANPVRSVLYSFVSYIQIVLSFAIAFLWLGWLEKGHFEKAITWDKSIFFSVGTIATIGYGDLGPKTISAQFFVILELLFGLFFIAIILAQVAGWATMSRREEGDYPLGDLKA